MHVLIGALLCVRIVLLVAIHREVNRADGLL